MGFPENQDPRVAAAIAILPALGIEPVPYAHGPADSVGLEAAIARALGDLNAGAIDAVVAGAVLPSATVIRTGIRDLGLAAGGALVSSCILLELPESKVVAFADCGVVPEPSSDQLAAIAIQTAATYAEVVGGEPLVAMLSFSTRGSATHPRAAKMAEAVEIARSLDPGMVVDGELQFDAAFVPDVAAVKAPRSLVAGRANVFVFPDLDSANIAYKVAHRLGNALAVGPLLQGLAATLHDLSRGASVEDIVAVAMVAALQAQGKRAHIVETAR